MEVSPAHPTRCVLAGGAACGHAGGGRQPRAGEGRCGVCVGGSGDVVLCGCEVVWGWGRGEGRGGGQPRAGDAGACVHPARLSSGLGGPESLQRSSCAAVGPGSAGPRMPAPISKPALSWPAHGCWTHPATRCNCQLPAPISIACPQGVWLGPGQAWVIYPSPWQRCPPC